MPFKRKMFLIARGKGSVTKLPGPYFSSGLILLHLSSLCVVLDLASLSLADLLPGGCGRSMCGRHRGERVFHLSLATGWLC